MKSTVIKAFKDASLNKSYEINDVYENDSEVVAKLEKMGFVKKVDAPKKTTKK